jgi:hypothetical protein
MMMIGIDPHKGSHTAVVVDDSEVVIGEIRVRASTGQASELREWASGFPDRAWAVESARGLGYLVSQQLVAAGERVIDVPAMLASRVRLLGSGKSQKTDPNDARSVAIAALRHSGLAIVRADDHARVLGLLAKRHRDVARMKNKVACRLHALLMELTAGGLASEMTVNKAQSLLEQVEISDEMTRQRVVIATELLDDMARLENADAGFEETDQGGGCRLGHHAVRHPWDRTDRRRHHLGLGGRHHPIPHCWPLRLLQRHRSHRGVLGRQEETSAQPEREPQTQSCPPHRGGFPAPIPQ